MNPESCYHESQSLRGLYRDRENGWIFGVCAGIGEYAGWRIGAVRVITVVSLVMFFWQTVLVYAVAALLFRDKPLTYSGRCREYDFWRRRSDHDRFTHE